MQFFIVCAVRSYYSSCSQGPSSSAGTHIGRLTLRARCCTGVSSRPYTAVLAWRSNQGKDWEQLTDRIGEVERLHSNAAKDAAAMQAMGVLVEAKALKLDMHGKA